MADALKLGFSAFADAPKGVLVVFCDNASSSAQPPQGVGVDRRPRGAGGEGRAFYRQERTAIELVMPQGLKVPRLVVIGAGKVARPAAQGFSQIGRHRHGQAAGKSVDRSNRVRRTVRGRHERGAGGRSGAGRAPARLCLRPLQDQAQGRRAARRDQVSVAVADVAATRAAFRPPRGDRRRRRHGARPGERAGERALPGGIRAPHRSAEKSRRGRRNPRRSRR